MTTKLAITAIFLFAVVLGIGAIAPAMAAKADAPGQNKVTICHFDEEENKYVPITIPFHAAEKHKANHGDVDPVDGSCPVIDTTVPVITLIGLDLIEITVGDEYFDQGATATDDVDGDITGNIVTVGDQIDTSVSGPNTVIYNVMDAAKNTAEQITRTVIVVDADPTDPSRNTAT